MRTPLLLAALCVPVTLAAATVGLLTSLVNGAQPFADPVNANFAALKAAVDDNAAQLSTASVNGFGTVFTLWGDDACPTGTEVVYQGFPGGKSHTHGGSGTNTLCMASQYDQYNDANHDGALIYGLEMEMGSYGLISFAPWNSLHDDSPRCAVCLDPAANDTLELMGTQTCPNGWTEQYVGMTMANHYTQASSTFVCVTQNARASQFSPFGSQNGTLWYPTEGECGSLPCGAGDFVQDREIPCVVCTR
jgi:hypothetical protein